MTLETLESLEPSGLAEAASWPLLEGSSFPVVGDPTKVVLEAGALQHDVHPQASPLPHSGPPGGRTGSRVRTV